MYSCQECKLPVVVTPQGEILKACKCKAAVIADMKATVYSHSKLRN